MSDRIYFFNENLDILKKLLKFLARDATDIIDFDTALALYTADQSVSEPILALSTRPKQLNVIPLYDRTFL